MTVKEFKEWARSIDPKYDDLEAVLESFRNYDVYGYNPIGVLGIEKTEIIDNFPENKEDNSSKEALILTIA